MTSDSPNRPSASRTILRPRSALLLLVLILAVMLFVFGLDWYRDQPLRDAEALLHAGQPHQALQALDALLVRRPDHHRGLLLKARVLVALEQWSDASRLFMQTGVDAPEELQAWAEALLHQQQFRDALPILERLTTDRPNDAPAWRKLTIARYQSGQWEAARDSAVKLGALPGHEVDGWFHQGVIYRAQGESHLAVECWEHIDKLAPNAAGLSISPAEFYRVFGEDLFTDSRPRLAIRYFRRSLNLQHDWHVVAQLGEACYRVGQDAEAESLWTEVLSNSQRSVLARTGLAEIALARNDSEKALEWLAPLMADERGVTPQVAYLARRAYTQQGNAESSAHWQELEARLLKSEKLQAAFAARSAESVP